MKMILKSSSVVFLILLTSSVFAQSKDTTMIVNGVCGMCQRVIEGAAGDLEGVQKVSWDKDTKVLDVSYDSEKITLQQISRAIVKSGYDTEYNTATDEDYYALHKCCYYRDPEVVKDHEKE